MSFTDKKESIILHTPYSRSNPVIQSFGAHPAHIDMPNGFGRFFVVLEDMHPHIARVKINLARTEFYV